MKFDKGEYYSMYKIIKSKFAPPKDELNVELPNYYLTYEECMKIFNTISIGNQIFFIILDEDTMKAIGYEN